MNTVKRNKKIIIIICAFLVLVIGAAFLIHFSSYRTATYSSQVVLPDYDEFLEESTLIVYGKVTGKSDPIVVLHVNGESTKVFTDYYIQPTEILRGSTDYDEITIRVDGGGPVDKTYHVYEEAPELKTNHEYLFIANTPTRGGFTTDEDYYYLRRKKYSVFEEATLADVQKVNLDESKVYFETAYYFSDDLAPKLVKTENGVDKELSIVPFDEIKIAATNLNSNISVIDSVKRLEDEQNKYLEMNLESGEISKEEYDLLLIEYQKYATRID